jgi:hypothetical protein
MEMIRFRLRVLLIVLALGPVLLWAAWLVYAMIDDALRIGF